MHQNPPLLTSGFYTEYTRTLLVADVIGGPAVQRAVVLRLLRQVAEARDKTIPRYPVSRYPLVLGDHRDGLRSQGGREGIEVL